MYHIGIDLGGTNIVAGITDESFRVLAKATLPTHAERGAEAVLQDMAALCQKLMQQTGLTIHDFPYAGVAAPGIANQDTGIVEYNNNLGFVQVPVAARLHELTGFSQVYLENDANAAALGEALAGAGKGKSIAVMLTLGTGVGGGVIMDGKVLRGAHHVGGELGHIVLEHRNGRMCSCGRRGCLEAYCSSTAFIKEAQQQMPLHPESLLWRLCAGNMQDIRPEMIFSAYRQEDALGKALLEEYIEYLACGLISIINIFDPDVVCLGGGISQAGSLLRDALLPKIEKETFGFPVNQGKQREARRLRLAELGNDAGFIGAAWLGGK